MIFRCSKNNHLLETVFWITHFQTPQMIIMTFDGAVNHNNFDHYQKIFSKDRVNPNSCPLKGTFFISHEYCNYNMVQSLAHDGHEIATETIS